jgi:F0F1-type ATP synthase assembly protein I
VPLDCVKQVVTKEVNMSNALGPVRSSIVMNRPQTKTEEKNMYIDAIILGAIAGFASVYYAEKKGMIETTSMNNKIIGAALGGAAFGYLTYRFKNKKK